MSKTIKDTRFKCPYCGTVTWNRDLVGFMQGHDRPDGRRCLQAARAYGVEHE